MEKEAERRLDALESFEKWRDSVGRDEYLSTYMPPERARESGRKTMERVKRAERFKDAYEAEASDSGMELGGTHLSFSSLEAREFKLQQPDESDEAFNERALAQNERTFIAYFLAQEQGGQEAVKEQFSAPGEIRDYKLKRTQKYEFYDAIAQLPEEEYNARVNGLLDTMPSGVDKRITWDMANLVFEKAMKRAEAGEEEGVSEPDFVERGPDYEYAEQREPYQPQVETVMNMEVEPAQNYHEAKQNRRIRNFLKKAGAAVKKFFQESTIDLEDAGVSRRELRRREERARREEMDLEEVLAEPRGGRFQHDENADPYSYTGEFTIGKSA